MADKSEVYTWTIVTCEYETATGEITAAYWRVSATDGSYGAGAEGVASFTPALASENFKPYNEVTEAEVLSWVWASVDKNEIEANLAEQIDAQKIPTSVSGVPWQNFAPPPLAYQARAERNRLLAESDWTQLPDVPEAARLAWAAYRQALRDVPEQEGFPENVVWPTKPE
jgi:hypothetical protein